MKYYSPKRPVQKETLIRQFTDVTWVEGFDADDHFTSWVKTKTNSPASLDHMASTIKHHWIMRDIVRNDVSEAIIFQDDPGEHEALLVTCETARNFVSIENYSFDALVEEYQNTMTVMYPQNGRGLANTLMHLCDFYASHSFVTSVVHDSINDYELGRWLKFTFPTTSMPGVKKEYTPKIFINPHTIQNVFPLVRNLIEPSDELKAVLKEHDMSDIKAGLHIRRGASAKDSRIVVEADTETFANDDAVARFHAFAERFQPVFLASDSPDTKKEFSCAKTIETTIAVVHGNCPDAPTKDRRNVFVDFFLLSMCPRVFVTSGNFPNHPGLSTFGLMAAIYGNKPFELVSNE